jgi:protein-S-isoprenylcysteine O-methyltransferase Ste14
VAAFILDPLRFQFKKLRILLAWTGSIILVFNAHFTHQSYCWGVALVLLGELVRILASGFLERKGTKLATAGPFAYVRNPLYVGNFLLGLGVVVMSGSWINVVIFIIGFCFLYGGTVQKEEARLLQEFGEPYADYLKEVPRFFPRLTPYSKKSDGTFQLSLIMKHREYITLSGVSIIISGVYLWIKFLEEGRLSFTMKSDLALALIGLALLVLIVEFVSKLIKKKQVAARL